MTIFYSFQHEIRDAKANGLWLSLAILAWQIFEMDTPYKGYSIAMHNNLVIEKGGRHTTYYDDNIYEWSAKGSSCVGNAGERSRDYEDSPTQAKASGISLFINSSRSLLVPFTFFLFFRTWSL